MRQWLITAALAALLAACASTPPPAPEPEPAAAQPDESQTPAALKARADLAAGIKLYDAGKYLEAQKLLDAALVDLYFAADHAVAHKHLAFIHCAATRIEQCREHFKVAFEADPEFNLSPSEIGHPIWGPVFKAVKSEQTAK